MLAAEAITVERGGAALLDRVNATVAPGRVTVILGPNGAGKSTLLACLAALIAPTRGTVTLDGQPLSAIDRRERARRIGYLPQDADVHWDVDVETLVGLGRFPHRGRWPNRAADARAIEAAMDATDCTAFAHRRVNTLSGGERARVLLARVLAGEPAWLLADEPLANLDPAHQLEALANLRRVADRGAGVVAVLHDLTLAARVADAVLLLRAGQVVAQGPADAMLNAATIAAAFGISVEIGTGSDGQRYVVPIGPVAKGTR